MSVTPNEVFGSAAGALAKAPTGMQMASPPGEPVPATPLLGVVGFGPDHHLRRSKRVDPIHQDSGHRRRASQPYLLSRNGFRASRMLEVQPHVRTTL